MKNKLIAFLIIFLVFVSSQEISAKSSWVPISKSVASLGVAASAVATWLLTYGFARMDHKGIGLGVGNDSIFLAGSFPISKIGKKWSRFLASVAAIPVAWFSFKYLFKRTPGGILSRAEDIIYGIECSNYDVLFAIQANFEDADLAKNSVINIFKLNCNELAKSFFALERLYNEFKLAESYLSTAKPYLGDFEVDAYNCAKEISDQTIELISKVLLSIKSMPEFKKQYENELRQLNINCYSNSI